MRGEFIGVRSETRREIWAPLIDEENVPEDVFCKAARWFPGAAPANCNLNEPLS